MPNVVCVDNQILSWGIREEATEGQEEMIPRAKAQFEIWTKTKTIVIVPSPVLGEFLVRIPLEKHTDVWGTFMRHFRIETYGAKAAMFAARIRQTIRKDDPQFADMTNRVIAVDCQILGVAWACSADALYTHDVRLQKMANKYRELNSQFVVRVSELPPLHRQATLLEE